MKMHFECWALCEMDDIGPPYEPEDMTARLLGMWLTREAMEMERQRIEFARRTEHEQREATFRWSHRPYEPSVYQFVPTSQMEFDSLATAQEMIESAAKLMQQGCAVAAGSEAR